LPLLPLFGLAVAILTSLPPPPPSASAAETLPTLISNADDDGVSKVSSSSPRKQRPPQRENTVGDDLRGMANQYDDDDDDERAAAKTPAAVALRKTAAPQSRNDTAVSGDASLASVIVDDGVRAPTFAEVLCIPGVLNLGAGYFCVKLVRYIMLFWLPYYLHVQLGVSQTSAGFLSSIFDVGGAPGAVASGYLADKYGRSVVIITSCCACAALLFLYSLVGGATIAVNSVVIGGIGLMIAGPDSLLGGATTQDACDRSPWGARASGAACGIVNGCGAIGAILQGPVTAWVTRAYGWTALFWLLAAIVGVGALALVPVFVAERGASSATGATSTKTSSSTDEVETPLLYDPSPSKARALR
jgi:hypothetical protein